MKQEANVACGNIEQHFSIDMLTRSVISIMSVSPPPLFFLLKPTSSTKYPLMLDADVGPFLALSMRHFSQSLSDT